MIDLTSAGYKITDAHIHPALLVDGSDFSQFKFTTPPEKFVATLKRAGISQAAGSVIRRFSETPAWEDIHQLNLAALEMQKMFPDFYIPGIHIHPAHVARSLDELEDMHRNHGVKLIGELVAYMMCYSEYSQPALDDVWKLAEELGMVISLHISTLEDAAALLKKFPNLKVIIAHPTASPAEFTARMELVARYPNTALDISGSGPNTYNMLRHAINIAGKGKVIFGTDFPLRNPGMYVAGVLFEELSEAEYTAIFHDNFHRLLGC